MTATETRAGAPEATVAAAAEPRGLAATFGTGDPRAIGTLFIGSSVLFLLVSGVAGALLSIERIDLSSLDVLEDSLGQALSLHSVAALFLFLLPLLIGVLAVVVPLQIGAPTVAFPRALAASFWAHLLGGVLVLGAFAINGGPSGGDAQGVDLFIAAMVLVLVALTVATVVLVTTVITSRAPGMTLRRTPLLAWSTLVGGAVWLLTLPVLAGMLVLVYVDHRYGRLFLGGNDGIYDRIAWAFRQPTVYAAAVPALGIIGDIIPVFARRRHTLHRVAMLAIGAFAVLSVGAWAQPAVDVTGEGADPPWLFDPPWIAVSMLIVLPLLVLLALWADTLRRGQVSLSSPLLLAIAAFLMLFVGVAQGMIGSVEDLEVYNSPWLTAQAHYVQLAAAIAAVGALVFWAPKVYGALVREALARTAALVLLLGTILLSFPDVISGILVDDADAEDTVEVLNAVSAAGGAVLLLAVLLLLAGFLGAGARRGAGPGDDPWAGHTLEWTTSSPPPPGNFAGLIDISSEAPLYDARYRDADTAEVGA